MFSEDKHFEVNSEDATNGTETKIKCWTTDANATANETKQRLVYQKYT